MSVFLLTPLFNVPLLNLNNADVTYMKNISLKYFPIVTVVLIFDDDKPPFTTPLMTLPFCHCLLCNRKANYNYFPLREIFLMIF